MVYRHDPLVESQLDIRSHKMFLVQIEYLIITSNKVYHIACCDNTPGHDITQREPEWNLKLALVVKDSVVGLYTCLGGQSATQVPLLLKL